jgi:F-type H+-transporting ATPase subunit alpha
MKNSPDDLSKIIESEIKSYLPKIDVQTVGEIIEVGDGIALVEGLADATMGEILEFPHNVRGLVLNLNIDTIGVILLGDYTSLKQGDKVKPTGQLLSIGASSELIGRVINPLGDPLDGLPIPKIDKLMPLEKIAPTVVDREPVKEPLQTGILAVDSMIPIGRGQRELIIGDRSTGKSSMALTSIINQKAGDVLCIYVAIGQKQSFIAQTISTLEKYGAMKHTIIVSASASEPAALQYLAPYAGCAVGEYFAQKGKDVLIVYDDLSKHAWSYREVSLLLRRPSGREAYPGDVFYLHSRLLERAVKFNQKLGGGSLTAIPIIETQAGDLSAYIPTNVISITDGQIFLDTNMFNAGQRPAIDIGISVSRVGGNAQLKSIKQVVGSLKIDMAQFRELAAFAQFSSDLDPKTKAKLERGQRITEILKQGWEEPIPVEQQVVLFWAVSKGYIDQVKLDSIRDWKIAYLEHFVSHHQKLLQLISKEKKLSQAEDNELDKIAAKFNDTHSQFFIETETKE